MLFFRLLQKLSLKFPDRQEEQEYIQIKFPIVKEFLSFIIIVLCAIQIPYAVRYFLKDISPQDYILVAIIILTILLALTKNTLEKYLGNYIELILLLYMIMLIGLLTSVYRVILPKEEMREPFYMGYAFAMIHRLVGYRVLKSTYLIILYAFSAAVKFPVIPTDDAVLILIVVTLDIVTVFLSFISEKSERKLFDSLYKSKKDIYKFKNLITNYLPNQMVIFSNDYSEPYYANNAFKRTFKCTKSKQSQSALKGLLIEPEGIERSKMLFTTLGLDVSQKVYMSTFMQHLALNIDYLRDIGMISFPVMETECENDEINNKPREVQEVKLQIGESIAPIIQVKDKINKGKYHRNRKEPHIRIFDNESLGTSERASSRSYSSDEMFEEGVKRVWKVKIFPLEWDEKDAIALVFDDITQQRIISELKVADKNKDLVIAMVSHELRTPINGILGLLDIAKKDIKQPDTLSYIKACKNTGVLMLNLVNSILDLNQIKNKKLKLAYTNVSLTDLLDEIKSLFEYYCKLKKLYLNVEMIGHVPKIIKTDKSRFTQILVNLLGNAFKFTFKGGITIKVKAESDRKLLFQVEDTGIGISKENQEKLFKMYGKLEQQDKKINIHGIGLGLTISNTLAALLNQPEGTGITVRSEVDVGTCFSFTISPPFAENSNGFDVSPETITSLNENSKDDTLPSKISAYNINQKGMFVRIATNSLDSDRKFTVACNLEPKTLESDRSTGILLTTRSMLNEEAPPTKKDINMIETIYEKDVGSESEIIQENFHEECKVYINKLWCLVVDDNPFNLMVASHIMEERGFRVKTALNGLDAINQIKEHYRSKKIFTACFMDCQMPVMDGYEATRRLREMMKNNELSEFPIIALTANNRDEEHDKLCRDVGMSGHIGKPLQVNELETILEWIKKPREIGDILEYA